MPRETTVTARLTGEEAARHASLAPDGRIPETIVAAITLTADGTRETVRESLVVYTRGTRADGSPASRSTAHHYTLTRSWARTLLPAAPAAMIDGLPS